MRLLERFGLLEPHPAPSTPTNWQTVDLYLLIQSVSLFTHVHPQSRRLSTKTTLLNRRTEVLLGMSAVACWGIILPK